MGKGRGDPHPGQAQPQSPGWHSPGSGRLGRDLGRKRWLLHQLGRGLISPKPLQAPHMPMGNWDPHSPGFDACGGIRTRQSLNYRGCQGLTSWLEGPAGWVSARCVASRVQAAPTQHWQQPQVDFQGSRLISRPINYSLRLPPPVPVPMSHPLAQNELRVAPTPLWQLKAQDEGAARRMQPRTPPPVPQGSGGTGGIQDTAVAPPGGGTQQGQQTIVDGDVSLPSH